MPMYNVILTRRVGLLGVVGWEVLNKTPMHKRAANTYAKVKSKELGVVLYDNAHWKYESLKWPTCNTITVEPVIEGEQKPDCSSTPA